jgi:hypothetical protein
MKKIVLFFTLFAFVGIAGAATTVTFTNDDVDLGSDSQINITDQYAGFGITVDKAYRYIDSRDTWDNYGISNGFKEDNYVTATMGTVIFETPTPYVTIDWFTFSSTQQFVVDVYDADGGLVDSFSGFDQGTETLQGAASIKTLTFHDEGGFVAISNMTFVPEPTALALLGLGGLLIRKRK